MMERIILIYGEEDLILFIEHFKENYEQFPSIQNMELVCMQMAVEKYPDYELEYTEVDEITLSIKLVLVKK